nr:hypothetical protein [Ardenticatena sp.]
MPPVVHLPDDMQRPLRVFDLLLSIQTILLAAMAYGLGISDRPNGWLNALLLPGTTWYWTFGAFFFIVVAMLALIATILFARRHAWAWHIALIVQAVLLGAGLYIYFFLPPVGDAPLLVYLLLGLAAFMTFYLHTFGLRLIMAQPTKR